MNDDKYIELYQSNIETIRGSYPEYIENFRQSSIDQYAQLGIPRKRSEKYKYTDLESAFDNGYNAYLTEKPAIIDVNEIFKCDVPDIGTDNVIIHNGFYYKKNVLNGWQPSGVWFGSIKQAFTELPEITQKHFGKYTSNDGITALNGGMFSDGFMLYVPKGKDHGKTIQIINVLLSNENLMVTHRNLIVLEDNATADILFCEHTLSQNRFLTNSLTEVYVGNNAQYNQVCLQNEHNNSTHITNTFIHQESHSRVSTNTISLHGGLIRNNLSAILNGEGAEHNSYGLALTDQNQHVDNNIFINHAKPHCTSNQLFKSVLDHQSTGAFGGRILVSRDAQKTLAYQRNSNLLLTDTAKMNTQPQLEIYADDVKCSHGATVGQLDQDALFYLRARGIPKDEARLLMMFAFTHEIIEQIKVEPLRERIDGMVNQRLRGELSKCNNCPMHCC